MNRTAVVGLKSKEVSGLSNNTHLFFGETVSFHQAYLIWMPFHFQDSEVCSGLITPHIRKVG